MWLTNGMRSSTTNVWESGNRDRRGCESGQQTVRGEGKDTRCDRPYLEYSVMRFRTVRATWVHRHWNSRKKWPECRYGAEEEEYPFSSTVTDDKWRIQHFQPESKWTSTRWHHPVSPVTKKFKLLPSVGKVMPVAGTTKAYCPSVLKSPVIPYCVVLLTLGH